MLITMAFQIKKWVKKGQSGATVINDISLNDLEDRISKMNLATHIGEEKNLDEFKNNGIFFFGTNAIPTNKPPNSENAAFLEVIDSGYYIMQRWTDFLNHKVFVRLYVPYEEQQWQNWTCLTEVKNTKDSNGWTVLNHGTYKEWIYKFEETIQFPNGWTGGIKQIPLPTGMTTLGENILTSSCGTNDGAIKVNVHCSKTKNLITINAYNAFSSSIETSLNVNLRILEIK